MNDLNKPPPITTTEHVMYNPVPLGWGMSLVKDPKEGGEYFGLIEFRTDSTAFGGFLPGTKFLEYAEAVANVATEMRSQLAQAERERSIFEEAEARKRVPIDVAEKVWAAVNVDEGDDVDAIRSSMPLPVDPTQTPTEG